LNSVQNNSIHPLIGVDVIIIVYSSLDGFGEISSFNCPGNAAAVPVSIVCLISHLITGNVGILFIHNTLFMMQTPWLSGGKVIRN